MVEDKENQLKQLAWIKEIIKMLPVRAQEAFYWAIENSDELEKICDDPDIAPENLPDMMAEAWEAENHALFMLLCISKTLKKSKNEGNNLNAGYYGDPRLDSDQSPL